MAVDFLITGAAGVLGRLVTEKLRAAGAEVVCSDRIESPEVDAIWDVSKHPGPQPDCQPEVVIHAAAAIGGYRQPLGQALEPFEVNSTGTLRVAQWCVARGVKRLVYLSSAIVYGDWADTPKSEKDRVRPWLAGSYAVSKFCGEQAARLVMQEGCSLGVLRLSSLIGPAYRSGLVPRMLKELAAKSQLDLEPPFGDRFDLLDADDAARSIVAAAKGTASGLWNIGGGQAVTIRELAELCAKTVGGKVNLARSEPKRRPKTLNWLDDRRAREDLHHANHVTLAASMRQIAAEI